jgi:TRAP-type uncharacterized transport system fused permease subunit
LADIAGQNPFSIRFRKSHGFYLFRISGQPGITVLGAIGRVGSENKLAGAKYWPTCIEAIKAAFASIMIPWMGIYAPIVLLRPTSLYAEAFQLVNGFFGLAAIQVVFCGYFMTNADLKERIGFLIAAVAFFAGVFTSNYIICLIIGLILVTVFSLSLWRKIQIEKKTNAAALG